MIYRQTFSSQVLILERKWQETFGLAISCGDAGQVGQTWACMMESLPKKRHLSRNERLKNTETYRNLNKCQEESEKINLVAHWMTVFSHLTHWDAHSQVPDPQADCTTHATSTLRVLLTCLHIHTGLRALSHYKYINISTFDSSKQTYQ